MKQFVVPLHGMDIEQHGARGIGIVCGMNLSACELPHEPRINGSHQQLAFVCCFAGTVYVVKQPLDTCCREIGVNKQTALLEHTLAIT